MAYAKRPNNFRGLFKELITEEVFHKLLSTGEGKSPAHPRCVIRNDGESRREIERRLVQELIGLEYNALSHEAWAMVWALAQNNKEE